MLISNEKKISIKKQHLYTIYNLFIERSRLSLTMTFALHFDRKNQIMSVVGATSTSERDAICAISQKKQVKTKDILKKLNKLRVLYEFNEQKINDFVF